MSLFLTLPHLDDLMLVNLPFPHRNFASVKDDRAFRFLHHELPQIFLLCIHYYLFSKLEKKLRSQEKFGRKWGSQF